MFVCVCYLQFIVTIYIYIYDVSPPMRQMMEIVICQFYNIKYLTLKPNRDIWYIPDNINRIIDIYL